MPNWLYILISDLWKCVNNVDANLFVAIYIKINCILVCDKLVKIATRTDTYQIYKEVCWVDIKYNKRSSNV